MRATGDLNGDPEAIRRCADMLCRLRARHGRYFVLGSSDYYAPKFKNYLDYFLKRKRHGTAKMPSADFKRRLIDEGWVDLTNRTMSTSIGALAIQMTGLDDPHLGRDDRSLLIREPDAAFALCVSHDPAPIFDAADAGFDLVVSGHTHGGQVRFPVVGALVTNSSIPTSMAMGMTKVQGTTLFVTRGLGTGKYAPFRFLCPPEAAALRLTSKDDEPL